MMKSSVLPTSFHAEGNGSSKKGLGQKASQYSKTTKQTTKKKHLFFLLIQLTHSIVDEDVVRGHSLPVELSRYKPSGRKLGHK